MVQISGFGRQEEFLSCIFEKQNASERSLSSHFQAIPLSQNWHKANNDLTTNLQTQISIH